VGFSSCSINSMQTYWWNNGGLSCLSYRDSTFRSSYNGDTSPVTVNTPSPVHNPTNDGSDSWSCVGISNLANYDGYWASTGRYNDGKPTYYQNGYYLYYLDYYGVWVLGQEEGSSGVFGYCATSDVSSCGTGLWYTYGDGWENDGDAYVYDCGDNTGGTDDTGGGSCSKYECLGIWGLMTDSNGNSYDGYWYPNGCHNGQSYYTRGGDYLCYSTDYELWIISDSLCGPGVKAYTWGDIDGVGSPAADAWGVWTGSWTADTDVYTYDCGGGSGAFEDCDGGDYGDDLCIFSNDTLWSGNRNFERSDQCSNGQPVFHFIEYTAASILEGLGNVDSVNFTLYLHYHRERIYSDSNETEAQWIISKDAISVNALALCQEEDVRDCTASSWLVDSVQVHDVGDFQDGLFQQVTDRPMTVHDAHCQDVGMEDGAGKRSSTTIIVVVAILLLAVICLAAFWWMNHGEKDVIKRKMETMGATNNAPSALDDDSGDEAAGNGVVSQQPVNVEVAPMTDDGVPVTATYQ